MEGEGAVRVIKVKYSNVDGPGGKWRSFKTLGRARVFAQYWVGKNPEIGSTCAVSGDGIGKIEVQGAKLADLFGDENKAEPDLPEVGEVVIYVVNALNQHFTSRAEAETKINAAREADPEGARGPDDIVEDTATADDFVPPVLPDPRD
jgi:hypothetical protein